jgi:CubicO group peptidase (beta-lactamase class C family)
VAFALVLWAPGPARAALAPAVDPAAVDSYLREQIAARRLPGLAVAVVADGRVVVLRGYGSAARGRPVTPRTQFFIGSCTKSFTALAVMQLVAQGRLRLDAPVRRYLPWFRVADDAASEAITARQLLNHTSGLSEGGDPRPNDRHASLVESARALAAVRPTAPPGATFQYYNQNYRVLGALIEHVSGQPYAGYLRDHVFAPLTMSRTTTDPRAAVDLAQGHAWVFGAPLVRPQGFDPGALSSGYIISTAEDMAHYLLAYLGGGRGGDAVASPDAFAQLLALPAGASGAQATPPPRGVVQLLGSSRDAEWGYAMGWLVAQTPGGRRLAFHAGSLERFRADMAPPARREEGFRDPGQRERRAAALLRTRSPVGRAGEDHARSPPPASTAREVESPPVRARRRCRHRDRPAQALAPAAVEGEGEATAAPGALVAGPRHGGRSGSLPPRGAGFPQLRGADERHVAGFPRFHSGRGVVAPGQRHHQPRSRPGQGGDPGSLLSRARRQGDPASTSSGS